MAVIVRLGFRPRTGRGRDDPPAVVPAAATALLLRRVQSHQYQRQNAGNDHRRQRRQLDWLLQGYREFGVFDTRELHLVETLRTLRLLHFNAWVARRWSDPAFPRAFPWFEDRRHWESVIAQLQEACRIAPADAEFPYLLALA